MTRTLTKAELERLSEYQKKVFAMHRENRLREQKADRASTNLFIIIIGLGVAFLVWMAWFTSDSEPVMVLEEKTCKQYIHKGKISECLEFETTYSTNPKWLAWDEREKTRQAEQQRYEEQQQQYQEQYEEAEYYEEDDIDLGPNSL